MAISRVHTWAAGEVLLASDLNAEFNNVLGNPVDLFSPAGKAINMNSFQINNLAAATARGDAASIATIQDGTGVYVATVDGTADVITLTPSPAIAAYVAGQRFDFLASGPNTTAVTVAISGLAAKAVTKFGSTALVANEIASGACVTIEYDGTRFQLKNINYLAAANTFTDALTLRRAAADDAVFEKMIVEGSVTHTVKGGPAGARQHMVFSNDGNGSYILNGLTIDSTGKVSAGIVPLARMQRTEGDAANSGSVTVNVSLITIVTLNLGTVNSGDRILISAAAGLTKGGTTGLTTVLVQQDSGTATIAALSGETRLFAPTTTHLLNTLFTFPVNGIIRVTGTGTLVLKLAGTSSSSDSTVAIGAGQLHAIVLNNG